MVTRLNNILNQETIITTIKASLAYQQIEIENIQRIWLKNWKIYKSKED
jgi:hypothetical protein